MNSRLTIMKKLTFLEVVMEYKKISNTLEKGANNMSPNDREKIIAARLAKNLLSDIEHDPNYDTLNRLLQFVYQLSWLTSK